MLYDVWRWLEGAIELPMVQDQLGAGGLVVGMLVVLVLGLLWTCWDTGVWNKPS